MNGFSWIFLDFSAGVRRQYTAEWFGAVCLSLSLWLEQIGQLLSAFGLCTMFAEGVLVRWMVPKLGEKLTLQIGMYVYVLPIYLVLFAWCRRSGKGRGWVSPHASCVPNWRNFVVISNTCLVM